MKKLIKRGLACISAVVILFTSIEVPMSTQATETDSIETTNTSLTDYSLEGVDLWGTEIIGKTVEDQVIINLKADDYEEFYNTLLDSIKQYIAAW